MKEKSIIQQNLKKIIGVIVVSVFAIIRFSSNAAITAVPAIPSFSIKYALAGCPPEADGVIAEKYTSAAE